MLKTEIYCNYVKIQWTNVVKRRNAIPGNGTIDFDASEPVLQIPLQITLNYLGYTRGTRESGDPIASAQVVTLV